MRDELQSDFSDGEKLIDDIMLTDCYSHAFNCENIKKSNQQIFSRVFHQTVKNKSRLEISQLASKNSCVNVNAKNVESFCFTNKQS